MLHHPHGRDAHATQKTLLLLVFFFFFLPGFVHAADPTTAPSDEIRRGVEMSGTPEERARKTYEAIARKVEPDGVGDIRRLPAYLEFYRREFVRDPRAFAVSLTAEGSTVTGYVETIEHQKSLADFLKYLKLENVEQRIELLPTKDLGDKAFATVTAEHCFLYDRPSGKSENLTEAFKGELVWLLKDSAQARILCHGPGGYVGWIDAGNIHPVTGDQLDSTINVNSVDARVEQVISAAKELLGVKYVWGGLSNEGVDCSGLVQRAFRRAGILLPRDADQQSLVGRLTAVRWHRSSMRRGDLMYFLSRRGTISHTAIYLGNDEFIEAGDGGVKISSLDAASDKHEKKRDDSFIFAKRVLE
jgi:cell wall-associated NlpC family hydrolase